MAYVTIRFPDELLAKAEARAAEAGLASVEEYLESLVRLDGNAATDPTVDPLSPIADAEVEALLLKRLESTGRDVQAPPWAPVPGGGQAGQLPAL